MTLDPELYPRRGARPSVVPAFDRGTMGGIAPLPRERAFAPNPQRDTIINIGVENRAKQAQQQAATTAFQNWYGGLKPDAKSALVGELGVTRQPAGSIRVVGQQGAAIERPLPGTMEDDASFEARIKSALQKHFETKVLPGDANYQKLAKTSSDATNARVSLTPLPQYQMQQEQITDVQQKRENETRETGAKVALAESQARGNTAAAARTEALTPVEVDAGKGQNTFNAEKLKQFTAMGPLTEEQAKAVIEAIRGKTATEGKLADNKVEQIGDLQKNYTAMQKQLADSTKQLDAFRRLIVNMTRHITPEGKQSMQDMLASLGMEGGETPGTAQATPAPAAPTAPPVAAPPQPATQPAPNLAGQIAGAQTMGPPAANAPATQAAPSAQQFQPQADGSFVHPHFPGVRYQKVNGGFQRIG